MLPSPDILVELTPRNLTADAKGISGAQSGVMKSGGHVCTGGEWTPRPFLPISHLPAAHGQPGIQWPRLPARTGVTGMDSMPGTWQSAFHVLFHKNCLSPQSCTGNCHPPISYFSRSQVRANPASPQPPTPTFSQPAPGTRYHLTSSVYIFLKGLEKRGEAEPQFHRFTQKENDILPPQWGLKGYT